MLCKICEFCERKKSPSWEKELLSELHASHLIARVRSISNRFTQMNRHTKAHKNSGPSPDPSPGGKGSDHRDTPIRRISALCCPLLVSMIVLTFCDICMPKAFCGFETVRNNALLNLCALWEKKLPCVRKKTPQRLACVSSHSEAAFYFSQIYTDEQTHRVSQRH